ncbi:hypothetical protein YB2330_001827 [Saitoella coloradoensis]
MAGPNMEMFRFAMYVFFPIASMYYFGDISFYNKYVAHLQLWPDSNPIEKLPQDSTDLKEELQKARQRRLEKKKLREAFGAEHNSNQGAAESS